MASDAQTAVVVIAIIAGIAVRTFLPYLRKIQNGDITSFDKKFAATAILALILALFTALEALSAFQMPDAAETWQGMIALFLGAFTYAWAFQSGLNLFPEAVQ